MTISFVAPDGVPVSAQQFRQAQAATHGGGSGRQLGLRSGFRVGTPSNILTASSTTWTLGPCAAEIDPGATTHQGGYGWSSDANVTGAVTAADATNPRKDIVYIQVNDSTAGDGSGAVTAPVLYLAGVADGLNVAPTLPARSFLVGTISVPAAGGGSPTVTLNPARYVAAGAVQPVSTQSERDTLTPYEGMVVQRLDLSSHPMERWTGTRWDQFTGRQHAEYTGPAFTTSAGFGTDFGGPADGLFVADAATTFNNGFVQPEGPGRVKVLVSGIYSLAGVILPTSVPASFSLNIDNVTSGARLASIGGVGYGDKEQSVSAPNVYLAANSVIEFRVATSNAITLGSRIRVTKLQ